MKIVNGYVFIPFLTNNGCLIFGKKIDDSSDGNYNNLSNNDLTPYDSIQNAIKGAKDFKMKRKSIDIEKIRIGDLYIKIAENINEIENKFSKIKSGLIVIMHTDMGLHFLGPCVEGKPSQYPLPGALITENGFETLNSIGKRSALYRAKYLASEVGRQGGCKSEIASFKIKFINSLI